MKYQLKEKKLLVTDTKLLENTRRWRLTYKGLTANLYAKMSERTRKKGLVKLVFSLEQFREWFEKSQVGGRLIYNEWVMSSWKKEKRPSVDRIDPRCHYTFDNMQVITAQENRKKGDMEKEILWGKRVKQMTLDGKLIAIYPSMKAAIKVTGVNQGLLSMACAGKRKQTGGYRWEIIGNIYENPELLK